MSEPGTASDADDLLRSLFDCLARADSLCVVKLDEDLRISDVRGTTWLTCAPGDDGNEALPFLSGLEATLADLDEADPPLTLANIGISPLAHEPVKVTGQIYRQGRGFLVNLTRIAGQDELEFEVTRQVRARRVAETELRAAERALVISAERLHEANAALRRANKELDSFANVISHDLKTPLRTIRQTLERVAIEFQARPDGQDNGYPGYIGIPARDFERIHAQAARMSSMISGLLTFARADNSADLVETIETGGLVDRIVRSMPLSPTGSGDAISVKRHGAWPRIETLVEPFDVTLRNILSNAIAHHDRVPGTINLNVRDEDDTIVYCVEDDGPGIPPHAQKHVFKPFRAADGVTADGSGLGLALVHRICEQVGASVWIDSPIAEGRGTRVSVRWPKSVAVASGE